MIADYSTRYEVRDYQVQARRRNLFIDSSCVALYSKPKQQASTLRRDFVGGRNNME